MTKDLQAVSATRSTRRCWAASSRPTLSVPARRGDYFYYSRTEEGKQYPIQCRRKGNMEAPEEVLLDLNELAKAHKFVGLGAFVVSDDQNLLAYTIDFTGFRQYRAAREGSAHRRDAARHHRARHIVRVGRRQQDAVPDHRGCGHQAQSDKLWRHVLGDADFRAGLRREGRALRHRHRARRATRQYLLLQIEAKDTTEVRYLRADRAAGQLRRLSAAREEAPLLRRPSRRTSSTSAPTKPGRNFRDHDRAGERSGSEELEGLHPASGRRAASKTSICSRISPCRSRRSQALNRLRVYDFKTGDVDGDRVPRAGLLRLSRRHARLRFDHLSLQLPELHHAAERLRLRHARPANPRC